MLALCRVGGLQTAIQLAIVRQEADDVGIHKEICPCCGEKGEEETIGHMLLECRRWDNPRRIHLSGLT